MKIIIQLNVIFDQQHINNFIFTILNKLRLYGFTIFNSTATCLCQLKIEEKESDLDLTLMQKQEGQI